MVVVVVAVVVGVVVAVAVVVVMPRPSVITPAEYERWLEHQAGGCAVCGRPPKTRRLDQDHDHRTGLFRGLLCHQCNRMLPAWMTPERLRAAAAYLETPLQDRARGAIMRPVCAYCSEPATVSGPACDAHSDLPGLERA